MMGFIIPFSIVLYLNLELQCDIIIDNKKMERSPIFCSLTDIVLDICWNKKLGECLLVQTETRDYLYRNFGIKLENEITWINATEKGRGDKL